MRNDVFLYTQASATKLNQKLVGLNGLEPSTSRLSGGRSNLLSYKPIFLIRFQPLLSKSRYHELQFGSESLSLGGDNRDRPDDPLLAKQVLSQLSYTPGVIPFFKVQSVTPHNAPLIRKKCPLLRKHHICFRKQ